MWRYLDTNCKDLCFYSGTGCRGCIKLSNRASAAAVHAYVVLQAFVIFSAVLIGAVVFCGVFLSERPDVFVTSISCCRKVLTAFSLLVC